MIIYIILIFNPLLVFASNLNCECGIINRSLNGNPRIVGGKYVSPNLYPWLAYITKFGKIHCAGTLINNRYVITAGHCLKWYELSSLKVYLGVHDRLHLTIPYNIEDAYVHENFTSDKLHDNNDIALLKLTKTVRFSKIVKPICLPNPVSEYSGRIATVIGWGKIYQTGRTSRYVKKGQVNVLHDSDCLKSNIGKHFSDSMLCAYTKYTDACQGDSGAPMLYGRSKSKMELIGIVSWGIGCGQTNSPGAYTKIVNFIEWIGKNTRDAAYCIKN